MKSTSFHDKRASIILPFFKEDIQGSLGSPEQYGMKSKMLLRVNMKRDQKKKNTTNNQREETRSGNTLIKMERIYQNTVQQESVEI